MLNHPDLLADVRMAFAALQAYIESGGRIGLTDANVHAEDFVAAVLNALWNWDLKNANQDKANHPCVDLIDSSSRIAVQVTAEKGVAKINGSIECVAKHQAVLRLKRLLVFVLVGRQTSYRVSASCPGLDFSAKRDVLDFNSVLRLLQPVRSSRDLERVHAEVTRAMPRLFASGQSVLLERARQLSENLSKRRTELAA